MPILKAGLCPLLTQNIIDKLGEHGIKRVIDFVCTEPAKITSECEVPYKTVLSIRRVLLAQYSSFPLNGANFYDESVATISILSTRCEELDNLLCSGIFTGEVTEIRGPAAAGKSQLCMGLAINIADSLAKNVIYIDSSGGFSPERTAELLKASSEVKHVSETLSRIRVSSCKSAYHLIDILAFIRTLLNSSDDRFSQGLKAIIVDSVTAALDPTLKDLSYLEGQSLLTMVKKELIALAKDFTLAVVVTTESYPASAGFKKWSKSPMGHTWSTAASTQLDLERSTGLDFLQFPVKSGMNFPRPVRIAVAKSSHTTEGSSLSFHITSKGFVPM